MTARSLFSTTLVLLLSFIASGCISNAKKTERTPNIIFILADDWGWTDWEMNGAQEGSNFYQTPAINELARAGIAFRQAYAYPLCSPSRAALLTGQYPGARLAMHQAITKKSVATPSVSKSCGKREKLCFPSSRNHLPLETLTIAEVLQSSGYRTFHFGKWHLGAKPYFPDKHGFEKQFAVGGAGPGRGGYFAPYQGLSDIPQGPDGEYLAERLTDEVIKTLAEMKNEKFFIFLAHYNVHSPYQAKPAYIQKYQNKKIIDQRHRHPVMAAMIQSLDESVGKISEALNQLGLVDDTILVLMGDNGGIHWQNDKKFPDTPITSNAPLRCGKACFYEGGIRVPLIIQYPKKISANQIEDTPVHIIDFFPTFAELGDAYDQTDSNQLDGTSLVPIFDGKEIKQRALFGHFPRRKQVGSPVGGSFIRRGDFKLYLHYGYNDDRSNKIELFNLKNDISETENLANKMPKERDAMVKELNQWLAETGALLPQKNLNYSP